jgi:uncharacterized protein (DUF2141 family)
MDHLITISLLLLTVAGVEAQNVEVTVTGIKSDKGQISVGVFLDNESFNEEEAYMGLKFPKTGINNGTLSFSISLAPGLYGLSILDDEDCDCKMKYGILGIPKEGFGFSDYYHTGVTKPKFDSFSFTVEENAVKKISVRMRYL